MEKPYPLVEGHRLYYVRYPVQVTKEIIRKYKKLKIDYMQVGKWICVDVLATGGYELVLGANPRDTEAECQAGCDMHNRFHGWTPEEVTEIVGTSMGLIEAK